MVTGWGRTISRGPIHTILQEVTVTTMTNKQCVSTVSSWEQQMTETMICAQAKAAGRDACKYFGGAPLAVLGQDGSYAQIGIVSWGERTCRGQIPGVYTRLTALLPWLTETIMDNN